MEILEIIQIKYVVSSILYSIIGILVLAIAFLMLDWLTPKVRIWYEIVENKNIALAIFLGSVTFGISNIIASAIHG